MTKKREEDKLLNSNYDEIEEYDNDLPKWWVYLFYLTIIGSVIYIGYYHYVPGAQTAEQLQVAMEGLEEIRAKAAPAVVDSSEEGLLKLAALDTSKAKGKEIWNARCAVCHGQNGEGLIGPNLTDKFWIHGGNITDIHRVIVQGVLDKGMLAWKGVLSDTEINDVVAFTWSLRNTNVANGKAPQGEPVE